MSAGINLVVRQSLSILVFLGARLAFAYRISYTGKCASRRLGQQGAVYVG
jgi:hypothetical protein